VRKYLDECLAGLNVDPPRIDILDAVVALADAYLQLTVPSFELPRRNLPASVHFVGAPSMIPNQAPLPHGRVEHRPCRCAGQLKSGVNIPTQRQRKNTSDRDVHAYEDRGRVEREDDGVRSNKHHRTAVRISEKKDDRRDYVHAWVDLARSSITSRARGAPAAWMGSRSDPPSTADTPRLRVPANLLYVVHGDIALAPRTTALT
jgi:hypothetical protein